MDFEEWDGWTMELYYKIQNYFSELWPQVRQFCDSILQGVKWFAQGARRTFYKLTSDDFYGLQETWYQQLRNNIFVQVALIILSVYAVYRLIYLPFFQDFLLAERCRIKMENTSPLKVGENIIYTISGFLPSVSDSRQDARTQKFFNALTAKVTLNEERISAMKAYAEEDHGRIKMIFTAEKSGTYKMDIRYNGFVIPGSPLEIIVPPDMMSAVDSEVNLPTMPVLLTDGMPQTIEIYPRDRTGYPCSFEGVRLDKFDFHASAERPCCKATVCGKTCELIGRRWKEGLDASFTYEGSPFGINQSGNNITVLLNIRTNYTPNSYGIFEGQVCYDGEILKNGCFPIISLTCEEYEKLEPTMREAKPTAVIHLRAEILETAKLIEALEETATVSGAGTSTSPISSLDKGAPQTFIEWYMLPKGITEMAGYTPITKEVYVNVCLNYIIIKEVEWSVLLSRSVIFPIQGDTTKIIAVPETEEKLRYLVTISDEIQSEITLLMSASNTRMLMALYLKFKSVISTTTCKIP